MRTVRGVRQAEQAQAKEQTRPSSRSAGVARLFAFAALSAGLHVGVFGALGRHATVRAASFDPTTQGLAGETLDVEPAAAAPVDADEDPSPAAESAGAPPLPGPGAAAPTARRPSKAPNAGAAAQASAHPPALFGAVGVRFASDLATSFTRAFPQAASADPIWPTVTPGGASSAEVTLVLDDEGRVVKSTIAVASPAALASTALRRGIDRTLILLGARPFTAHGSVTRLHLSARVSRDDVHDGLHGEVFALSGGSFSGDVGSAFFALPPTAGAGSRRIDVEVRLLP